MRVNVVRNAWKIVRPEYPLGGRTFYDSSLWESRQLEDPETLKRLIREGVGYTSAVCVLVGTETALRRWVRYEIARAVIDKRGLLAVHLNGVRHHKLLIPGLIRLHLWPSARFSQIIRCCRHFTIYSSTPNKGGFGIGITLPQCRYPRTFPTHPRVT